MSKIVITWLVYAALAAGAMSGIYFVWQHYVANPYRAEGRAQLQPALNIAVAQLQEDIVGFKTIEGYFVAIKKKSDAVAKALEDATKLNSKRQVIETKKIEYIDRFTPTGTSECLKTNDAITKLLR